MNGRQGGHGIGKREVREGKFFVRDHTTEEEEQGNAKEVGEGGEGMGG